MQPPPTVGVGIFLLVYPQPRASKTEAVIRCKWTLDAHSQTGGHLLSTPVYHGCLLQTKLDHHSTVFESSPLTRLQSPSNGYCKLNFRNSKCLQPNPMIGKVSFLNLMGNVLMPGAAPSTIQTRNLSRNLPQSPCQRKEIPLAASPSQTT